MRFKWPWSEMEKTSERQPTQVQFAREFSIPSLKSMEVARIIDEIAAGENKMQNELLLWRELEGMFPDVASGEWFVQRKGAGLIVKERLPVQPPDLCY